MTDYLPAIFGEDMKAYLEEFRAAMPAFAVTFNIAGSFKADDVSAWYRSPVELGWANCIKFDHDFFGRPALEAEVAHPRRVMGRWSGTLMMSLSSTPRSSVRASPTTTWKCRAISGASCMPTRS